mmetsp:Transcript_41505/g.129937  ORF Transcript_41505/g.129937 Transcript_41505/m.129937 type:complete len:248 (+) Transcript_41505:140-883(+)
MRRPALLALSLMGLAQALRTKPVLPGGGVPWRQSKRESRHVLNSNYALEQLRRQRLSADPDEPNAKARKFRSFRSAFASLPVLSPGFTLQVGGAVLFTLTLSTVLLKILEGIPMLDALYFAITVTTTAGYGDFTPTSTLSRILVSALSFGGLGLIGTLAAGVVGDFAWSLDDTVRSSQTVAGDARRGAIWGYTNRSLLSGAAKRLRLDKLGVVIRALTRTLAMALTITRTLTLTLTRTLAPNPKPKT